jgi:hypothetical protein
VAGEVFSCPEPLLLSTIVFFPSPSLILFFPPLTGCRCQFFSIDNLNYCRWRIESSCIQVRTPHPPRTAMLAMLAIPASSTTKIRSRSPPTYRLFQSYNCNSTDSLSSSRAFSYRAIIIPVFHTTTPSVKWLQFYPNLHLLSHPQPPLAPFITMISLLLFSNILFPSATLHLASRGVKYTMKRVLLNVENNNAIYYVLHIILI